MSFSGKVVIVTGASSGIGAATAVLFAKEGASVTIVGRNETKLGNVAKQCEEHGAIALVIKADVSNEKEVSTIVKRTVDKFGKLDILINNAGILGYASVADPNIIKSFDEVMNTNVRPAVQLTSFAAPYLVETKGNIVNVSSVAALKVTGQNCMSYCVSKAALDHFTRCAALDLSQSGVRVNSVNPGPVQTDIAENSGMNVTEEMIKHAAAMTAMGKIAQPEEIADVIAFLASDKAKCITGSMYLCDNGTMLK